MKTDAQTPEEYLSSLPAERKAPVKRLREIILENLPVGFSEEMGYGMLAYVVPHSIYPKGYHCNPDLPLPYINLASQKNFIALYHMGLYLDQELLDWFTQEYLNETGKKPDMGKSCIRFKKPEQIPFLLIGKLVSKRSPEEWISQYELAARK